MTDGRIKLIADRWARITESIWDELVTDVRLWGTAPGFTYDLARMRHDILTLLGEVQFLRGLLSDLCQESRAAAEAAKLRRVCAEMAAQIDAGLDAIEHYRPEWPVLEKGLANLREIAQRGLEGGGAE